MIKDDANFQKDLTVKEPKILDGYNLDVNYITSAQVEHEARNLYCRKVMF